MTYMPHIVSATPKKKFTFGTRTAVLFCNIISAGQIKYHLIMAVFEEDSDTPCYAVASEENAFAKVFGGGSHIIGLFPGEVHVNLGDSDDWADEDKFSAEALKLIANKFGPASD
jgi:hypothetical protein